MLTLGAFDAIVTGLAGGVAFSVFSPLLDRLVNRFWPDPPAARHKVQLFDEHGVPIGTHTLSGKGMAELIRHLDDQWYR
jgi:hypothetical protein